MEFVIGGVSALMDARFAAAAGTERVVLFPWTSQAHTIPGIDPPREATGEPEGPGAEILKEALAVWNEIKGWVSGPEIWLAAPWPYLTLALKAFDTFDDCCGIMVNAAQPSEPTLLQHPPFEIPPRIPYAVNYSLGAPGTAHLWTAQHPPDWVVMVPNLIHSLSPDAGTLRYLCVEDLKEVTVWRKAQDLPPIAGIYLQADVTKATDYEVWQEIIDAL